MMLMFQWFVFHEIIDLKKLSALTKKETLVIDCIHLINYFHCVA
jgi:hypothetical protein